MTPTERVPMAHFKCVACNTRQYRAARPADLVARFSPGPVAEA